MTSYFTPLKMFWDLIQEFRPQPICTCGAMKTITEYQDEDRVLQFLIGLNESYTHIPEVNFFFKNPSLISIVFLQQWFKKKSNAGFLPRPWLNPFVFLNSEPIRRCFSAVKAEGHLLALWDSRP